VLKQIDFFLLEIKSLFFLATSSFFHIAMKIPYIIQSCKFSLYTIVRKTSVNKIGDTNVVHDIQDNKFTKSWKSFD